MRNTGRGRRLFAGTTESAHNSLDLCLNDFWVYWEFIEKQDRISVGYILPASQPNQGSHSTWKTWKNESTPGKPGNIMEFWKI